ncbi:MAG TPA: hypothetical protein VIY52_35010 [Streptosporangiaceae bacterium]
MRTLPIVKTGLGGGAAILLAGFLAAAPAQASTGVPCNTAALINAITAANTSGGTINLAPGCTYALTQVNNTDPVAGPNGLPEITSRITINGFRTTIAGNGTFRILMVTGSGNLTVQGLTITGGTGNVGGGIANLEGTLTVNHTAVTGNTATAIGGGGIFSGTMGTGPVGATTLNFSQVNGNTSLSSAGGILNHAGTLILNASQVSGNTAAVGGGGIASGTGGLGGNSSSFLTVTLSQIDHNTANGGPASGAGGIANGGTATINASQVNGNIAPGGNGGGILNHGAMTINASTVNNNTTPTDSSGDLGGGGGIANLNITPLTGVADSGVLTITLSQVNGNTGTGHGGGILEDGVNPNDTLGPPGGPLTLKFSQVIGNSAGIGGGIFASAGSPVTLKITLIARNTPDNCAPLGSVSGCKN